MNQNELDRFGGWNGKTFEATGFFRTEKSDRWWLVTPEGNAFLSFGISHLHEHFWKPLGMRYDPHHMFFGDKINANTDTLDTVLPVTSQYTDVVFYRMYAQYELQKTGLDRWSKFVDKPIINGDSAYTMIIDTMPRPYGPVADNFKQSIFHLDALTEELPVRPAEIVTLAFT